MQEPTVQHFRETLLAWFRQNHRPMPWKGEKDPYLLWLSEIILQQTRVEQGLPYYQAFKQKYPTVEALAAASQDEVMKLWEGLGYYSRARNLHAAARYVAHELQGRFPTDYEGILSLKGVGPYTAAAIASFAYNLPRAVVDGNVFRVLARIYGINTPIDSSTGKKEFSGLAEKLLSPQQPAAHNQAMMDFGATQCTPRAPACTSCPFRENCVAHTTNQVGSLPVKARKASRKGRFFHYLVIRKNGQALLNKRTGKDIWRNLYEFPLIEHPHPIREEEEMRETEAWQQLLGEKRVEIRRVSPPVQQLLTHQKIQATFWETELLSRHFPDGPFLAVKWEELPQYAFPKIISRYLGRTQLSLF